MFADLFFEYRPRVCMRMEDKITLRREIVMQENAAKIRVKTGNSGAFTEKIEKNQKIFQIFFKNA